MLETTAAMEGLGVQRMPKGVFMPHLRAVRLRLYLDPAALAERAGVCESTIYHAERGRRVHLSTVRLLAQALEVSPDELCAGEAPEAS